MQYRLSISSLRFVFLVIVSFSSLVVLADEVIPGEYLVTYNQNSTRTSRSLSTQSLGLNVIQNYELIDTTLVSLPKGRSLDKKTIKELKRSGIIKSIEPNFRVKAFATPNDSKYSQMWGLNNTGQSGGTVDVDIDAPEAWNISQGSSEVIIAVLDTGVLYTHPDLKNNMWNNSAEIPGNGIDDDGNGYVDDVHGINSITNAGDPKDDNGHGTHCAGVIAGVTNNSEGISGVSWNSKIMALKFLDNSGSGSLSDAIQGIQYVIAMKQKGVNVKAISNSWGGSGYSASLESAIELANSYGIVFIAAAGNESNDNDSKASYPASYDLDNVITVAALDKSGNLASFSNFGRNSVHVAAPGVSILSTYLNNQYTLLSGTSMATPFVSGITALILSTQNLTPLQVKSKLMSTVKPLNTLQGLVKSAGIVSAYRALSDSSIPLPPVNNTISYKSTPKAYDWNEDLGSKISSADDAYVLVNTNFDFKYFGTSYRKFAISTNGRIQPLAQDESAPTTEDYNSSLYKGISPYNADLVASNISNDGGVWAKDNGSSLRITWVSIPYEINNSSSSDKEIRFSVTLKASGDIEFNYNDTNTGNTNYDYGNRAVVSLSPISPGSGTNLIISNTTSNEAIIGNQKGLTISSQSKAVFNDIDGDSKSDLIVWRPSTAMFYISPSSAIYDSKSTLSYQLGLPGDIPKSGEFDGDKKTDLAVFRPSNGTWYLRMSSGSFETITSIQWGLPGDQPLVGDVDGDGVSDLIVYRPNSAAFFVLLSSQGFNRSAAFSGTASSVRAVSLGGPANDPVIGDANGDGTDDLGTVWQLVRFWTLKTSENATIYSLPWGMPGDTPLFCNLDSDKIADRVIARVESNNSLSWYTAYGTGAGSVVSFGSLGDTPSCKMDTNGDGQGDYVAFRNNSGIWFLKESNSDLITQYQFGLPGDIPLTL